MSPDTIGKAGRSKLVTAWTRDLYGFTKLQTFWVVVANSEANTVLTYTYIYATFEVLMDDELDYKLKGYEFWLQISKFQSSERKCVSHKKIIYY